MATTQLYRDLMQTLEDIDGHSMAHSKGVSHGFFDARLDALNKPGFRFGEARALRIMEQTERTPEDSDYLDGYFSGRREADEASGARDLALDGGNL